MRRISLRTLVLCVASAALPPQASAQPVSDEATTHPAAPLETTQYGPRLTPEIARGMSRVAIQHNLTGELGLSDAQVDALTESSARHLMAMGHAHGRAIRDMITHSIRSMMNSQGRFDSDTARQFAEHTLPVMPAYNQMLDRFTKDAGEILSDEQMAGFEDWMKDYRAEVNAFEQRMERWRAGDAQEGENPFAPSPVPEERAGRLKDEVASDRQVRRARGYAQWELRRLGPSQWKAFLADAGRFFEFTEAQMARGEALVDEYTGRYNEATTDEWRSRFEKNRILDRMRWSMRDLSRGPWAYHIEREYEELVMPIDELGDAFRRDVLALITDAQREKAVAELKDKADRHGMAPETWMQMESILMSLAPSATQASGEIETRGN